MKENDDSSDASSDASSTSTSFFIESDDEEDLSEFRAPFYESDSDVLKMNQLLSKLFEVSDFPELLRARKAEERDNDSQHTHTKHSFVDGLSRSQETPDVSFEQDGAKTLLIHKPLVDKDEWITLKSSDYTSDKSVKISKVAVPHLYGTEWCFETCSKSGSYHQSSTTMKNPYMISLEEYNWLWRRIIVRIFQFDDYTEVRKWILSSSQLKEPYQEVFSTSAQIILIYLKHLRCTTYQAFSKVNRAVESTLCAITQLVNHEAEWEILPKTIHPVIEDYCNLLICFVQTNPGAHFVPECLHQASDIWGNNYPAKQLRKLQNTWIELELRAKVFAATRKFILNSAAGKNTQKQYYCPSTSARHYMIIYAAIWPTYKTLIGRKHLKPVYRLFKILAVLPFALQGMFPKLLPRNVGFQVETINYDDELRSSFEERYDDCDHDLYMAFVAAHYIGSRVTNSEYALMDYCVAQLYGCYLKSGNDRVKFKLTLENLSIRSDFFFGLLFEYSKSVHFQRGEIFFTLIIYLHLYPATRDSFSQYIERAADLFIKSIDSFLEFGSLLVYLLRLKEFLPADCIIRIEEALLNRLKTETIFIEYFFAEEGATISYDHKRASKSFPRVFFYCFTKVFMFFTQDEDEYRQRLCLDRLTESIEGSPHLMILLTTSKTVGNEYFHQFVLNRRFHTKKYIPLDQLRNIFSKDWGSVLTNLGKLRFESYDQTKLLKLRDIASHGQADVSLVQSTRLVFPAVAKYFRQGYSELRDEICSLLTLQCNPHIVHIYGYIEHKGSIIGILMEYYGGGSLETIVKSQKIYSEKQIVSWIHQAACGLNYLHSNDIVHRDVKPANMLLDAKHCVLKINDLGLTKRGTGKYGTVVFNNTSEKGTFGYMAPEIALGDLDHFTPKVDVFGLGRSVWNMIYRVYPYENVVAETLKTVPTVLMKQSVTPEIWKFVVRMMCDKIDERPTMEQTYMFFKENDSQLPRLDTSSL